MQKNDMDMEMLWESERTTPNLHCPSEQCMLIWIKEQCNAFHLERAIYLDIAFK